MDIKIERPLIFIPGLFGSMGNDIVPGTGDWKFGITIEAYERLIDHLEQFGYIQDVNLFICFYDWRNSCEDNARKYLVDTIDKVKKKCHIDEVDLICHSLGGLVARAYVQSTYYNHDVSKLILLATPNTGSPSYYSYWVGGRLPDEHHKNNILTGHYMNAFIHSMKEQFGDKLDSVHQNFPSLKDLIPSMQYGDFLYQLKPDDSLVFIPQSDMNTTNGFLNELNQNASIIKERHIDVHLIAAIGEHTIKYLQVNPNEINQSPISYTLTNYGDGNTTLESVFSLEGKKYIIMGNHVNMLCKCGTIVKEILKND